MVDCLLCFFRMLQNAESMMPVRFRCARRLKWPVRYLNIVVCSCLAWRLIRAVEGVKPAVCLLVGCLTYRHHASVSQGRICSDNFTCCHTEAEVADQALCLTQLRYTDSDTDPYSSSADPVTPGAWQGGHWSVNFQVTGVTRP